MLKATKIRLYPTSQQESLLSIQFGAVRWIFNHSLNWRSEAYKQDQTSISKRQMLENIVVLKKQSDTEWLKQADSQALQQSVMNLDLAFQRFFKNQGRYPRFKSKHGKQSFSYPQRVKITNENMLYLPKVGNVKAVFHRPIKGTIKTVTISKSSSGKYFASILTEDGAQIPKPSQNIKDTNITGVDFGISTLATFDTGRKEANPRYLKKAAQNLRQKQKALSRKKKGSANRSKARVLVAKAHEKTANTRNDFQHKLSKQLIDENQAIVVETLKVKNMLKNRKLAKHIADVSWGELVRKLEYKAKWSGKHLVKIDQWYASSKTCHVCKHKIKNMPLSTRVWICENCGTEHDRDINAAINIKQQGILKLKAEGLSVSACGGSRKSGVMPVVA